MFIAIPLLPHETGEESYYKEKYGTHVVITDRIYSAAGEEFIATIQAGREKPGDFRCAFILAGMRHATPVFYIKEGSREAILIPDSVGREDPHNYGQVDKIISEFILDELPGVPILLIPEKRQADLVSCYADALVFARDITAKRAGIYFQSPMVLEQLMSRSTQQSVSIRRGMSKENVTLHDALLPDVLLKTAQISKFVERHITPNKSDAMRPIVHAGKDGVSENIEQFRKRYSAVTPPHNEKSYNTYLRNKGMKYSKIIIMQYYKNEILRALICAGIKQELALSQANKFVLYVKNSGMEITNDVIFSSSQKFVMDVIKESDASATPNAQSTARTSSSPFLFHLPDDKKTPSEPESLDQNQKSAADCMSRKPGS